MAEIKRPIPRVPPEEDYTANNHDFKVCIFGQDVTPWVMSSPSITDSGHGSPNTCSFTLSNPMDIFAWTLRNLQNSEFNEAEGAYSEIPKKNIYNYRRAAQEVRNQGVTSFGGNAPVSEIIPGQTTAGANVTQSENTVARTSDGDVTLVNIAQINGNLQNQSTLPIQDVLYPLILGSAIFSKYDPVRVYRRWPYTAEDWWYPRFTGLITDVSKSNDLVSGLSSISISCSCIREAMSHMRVQTNSVPLNIQTVIPEVLVTEGLFSDLVLNSAGTIVDSEGKSSVGWFNHTLAPLDFPEVIALLTFGITEVVVNSTVTPNSQVVPVAKPPQKPRAELTPFNKQQPDSQTMDVGGVTVTTNEVATVKLLAGRAKLGNLQKGVFGAKYVDGSGIQYAGVPAPSSGLTVTMEAWHYLCNLGVLPGLMTLQEVNEAMAGCIPGGATDPWSATVNLIVPYGAENVSYDLFSKTRMTVADGATYTREWSTRLAILNEVCESIDYQFWVSPNGDLIFEFPQYDFLPCDYGMFSTSLEVDKHIVPESTVSDESGDIPSVVSVTGGISWEEVGRTVADSSMIKGIAWSPALVHRYGVNEKSINRPYIYDRRLLENHARLELQKALAEANSLQCSFVYRPFLTPNRPFFVKPEMRLGTTTSVSESIPMESEEPSQSADLKYIRRASIDFGQLHFRFITAGFSSPVPYNLLYLQKRLSSAETSELLSKNTKLPAGGFVSTPIDISRISFTTDVDCESARLPVSNVLLNGTGSASSSSTDSDPWDRTGGGISAIPPNGVGNLNSRSEFLVAMQQAVDKANRATNVGDSKYPVTIEDLWTQIYHESSNFVLGKASNLRGAVEKGSPTNWNNYMDAHANDSRKGTAPDDGLGLAQLDAGSGYNNLRRLAGLPTFDHPAKYYSSSSTNRISPEIAQRIKDMDPLLGSMKDDDPGLAIFDVQNQLDTAALMIKSSKARVARIASRYSNSGSFAKSKDWKALGTALISSVNDTGLNYLCENQFDCSAEEIINSLVTSMVGVLGGMSTKWFLDGLCNYSIDSSAWKNFYADNKSKPVFLKVKADKTVPGDTHEKAVFRRVRAACTALRNKIKIRRTFAKDLESRTLSGYSGVHSTSRSLP